MSLKLLNVCATCKAKIFHWGEYIDQVGWLSYEFEDGKSYLINNDIGDGGWALSYFLAGYYKGDEDAENHVILDKTYLTQRLRKRMVCYVGHRTTNYFRYYKIPLYRFFRWNYFTVIKEIERGLSRSVKNITSKEICEIFNLSTFGEVESRIYRPIEATSQEFWRATMAIDYANNKKVFVFPQLTKELIDRYFIWDWNPLINRLKKDNCIILIPTMFKEKFLESTDFIIDLKKMTLKHTFEAQNEFNINTKINM